MSQFSISSCQFTALRLESKLEARRLSPFELETVSWKLTSGDWLVSR